MKVDLHIHSNWSDGSLGIPEIVSLAKKLKLDAISITDHDSMKGQAQAIEEGKRQGIKIITGVEISAYNPDTGRKAHILGYNVKDMDAVTKVCNPFLIYRHEKNIQSIEKISNAGYPIDINDVKNYHALDSIVYRQHIMHALVDRGYASSIYGDLYKKLFGKGGIAEVKATYINAIEAVKLILDCGGYPVLAHPFQYDSMEYLPHLVSAGLKGIEYHHHTQTEDRQKAVIDAADKFNLFLTGGSDFHGFYSELALPPGNMNTELAGDHPLFVHYI